MTLLLTESFEFTPNGSALSSDKWNLTVSMTRVNTNPRTGSWCGATLIAKRQVAAADEHATFIMGAAFRKAGTTGGAQLFAFMSDAGATDHVDLAIDGTDETKLKVVRGSTTLGTTASGVIPADSTYRYIEMKVTLHDTTGSVVVKVDGTTVLNLTNVDTKNGGTKTVFDSFQLSGSTSNLRIDDFYACNGAGTVNNDFLGPVRIEALSPNGNGNSSGMTGSDGNSTDNYLLVDDDPTATPNEADYVEASAASVKDTYAMGNSGQPTGNAVKAVVVYLWAQKTDAGARGIDTVTRLSSTEQTVTPAVALVNGVYHLLWGIHEQKPGGGDWTVSDVNSMEAGMVST